MNSRLLLQDVRTPRDGGDQWDNMEEENDVEEKGIGNFAVAEYLEIAPGRLVGNPQRQAECDQGPETALRAGAGSRIGKRGTGSGEHQDQAGEIGKDGEREALVCEERHSGKGQSNSGRCREPAVARKQTHPPPFYGS